MHKGANCKSIIVCTTTSIRASFLVSNLAYFSHFPPLHHTSLLLPRPVQDLAPILFSLLQQHLPLPLGHIASVDPPAGLKAEAAARLASGNAVHRGNVDVLARVKLEGGLGAVHLKVDLGLGVERAEVLLKGQRARVDGDRRRVLVDDEAVVDVGLNSTEGEGDVAGLVGRVEEGREAAGGDTALVDR